MILLGYVTRLFALRWLAALAGFVALSGIFDLFDHADRVLLRGGGLAELARYAWLRLPLNTESAMPFAALIGAAATLFALARHGEIVALRAAGVALFRLLAAMVPFALAVGALHFAFSDRVAPWAEAELRTFFTDVLPAPEEKESGGERRWLRSAGTIVSFAGEQNNGRRLDRLLVYDRDGRGRLVRRIAAERALWAGGAWRLEGAVVSRRGAGGWRATPEATAVWDIGLTPGELLDLAAPTEHLPLNRLERVLAGDRAGVAGRAVYETRRQALRALVLAPALMVLLAAPVAFGAAGRGTMAPGLGGALGLGLSFLLVDGMARALGEAGMLAPALAAWAPTAFFALVGASIVLHAEG